MSDYTPFTYDPAANPRYLQGPFDVDPALEEETRPDLGRLVRDAEASREVLDTLATPGWRHIVATLQDMHARRTAMLQADGVNDLALIGRLRGEIRQIVWFLNFTAQVQAEYDAVTQEIERELQSQ